MTEEMLSETHPIKHHGHGRDVLWLREHDAPTVVREPHLVERVICVGGDPGCGKTLFTAVVGSLARVEIMKYNYTLEHLASLHLLGKLDDDAATAMIRMIMDTDLYHLTQSREVNLRPSDLSSIFRNPGGWRYLRRMFQAGDAAAAERVRATRPILHYVIHYVLPFSPSFFMAMGDRLRILLIVRHPLYMIKQWYLYIHRYGTDVRDLTVWFDHHGTAVPFFARGWEGRYLDANLMDRAIYSIEHLDQWGQRILQGLAPDQRSRILIIPFERFIRDPWPSLRELETLLGTEVTELTRRELRRQRVPRKRIAEGIPLPIYKQYGWQPPRKRSTEREELALRRDFAARLASADGLRVLDRLCAEYEAAYLGDGLLQ